MMQVVYRHVTLVFGRVKLGQVGPRGTLRADEMPRVDAAVTQPQTAAQPAPPSSFDETSKLPLKEGAEDDKT